MRDFLLLGNLTWNVLALFLVQMLIFTVVTRGVVAGLTRLLRGSWRQHIGHVIAAHAAALLVFAAITDFLDVAAAPASDIVALIHSVAVLWPLQTVLLVADLATRAGLSAAQKRAAS